MLMSLLEGCLSPLTQNVAKHPSNEKINIPPMNSDPSEGVTNAGTTFLDSEYFTFHEIYSVLREKDFTPW